MNIFSMDASGRSAAACLLADGRVAAHRRIDEGLTHSETLLALADEVFRAGGQCPAGIDLFAVTAGPGSFTGLRIGMALAKGLALPTGAPLAAVSTLEAHARGCGLRGSVVVALDARRGEVYWAAFDTREGYRRLTPDVAAPAAALAGTLADLPPPIYLIGDGAGICYTMYRDRFAMRQAEEAGSVALGAALAAAEGSGLARPARHARPEYLRLSQAERERAAKLKGGSQNV